MSEEENQQPQKQEEKQEQILHSEIAEHCGGPLICINCAMRYAQAYFNAGKGLWADYYYRHAIRLRNETEMIKLQQESQQLAMANIELEKQIRIQQANLETGKQK